MSVSQLESVFEFCSVPCCVGILYILLDAFFLFSGILSFLFSLQHFCECFPFFVRVDSHLFGWSIHSLLLDLFHSSSPLYFLFLFLYHPRFFSFSPYFQAVSVWFQQSLSLAGRLLFNAFIRGNRIDTTRARAALKSVDDFFPTLRLSFLSSPPAGKRTLHYRHRSLGFSSIMNDDDSRRPPIPSLLLEPIATAFCMWKESKNRLHLKLKIKSFQTRNSDDVNGACGLCVLPTFYFLYPLS